MIFHSNKMSKLFWYWRSDLYKSFCREYKFDKEVISEMIKDYNNLLYDAQFWGNNPNIQRDAEKAKNIVKFIKFIMNDSESRLYVIKELKKRNIDYKEFV